MTTVQAFYMALGAADGNDASKFVIAEKRSSGPLSASVITTFYGKLIVPLTLDILPIGSISIGFVTVMSRLVRGDVMGSLSFEQLK